MKFMQWNRFFKFCCMIAFFCLLFFAVQRLLIPKYQDNDIREGSMIAEYYGEEHDFDVIMIGNCEVYSTYIPAEIWQNYGINSYIRGSAEQYMPQTYYLLEETLKYETPKVVVFNVLSLIYDEARTEAYNRMTMDGMKNSKIKYDCIRASKMEDETMQSYVFPLLRFHTRWKDVNQSDIDHYFTKDPVTHNGYYMRVDVKGVDYIPNPKPLADPALPEKSMEYLDKMQKLCEENGISLLLVKAPSVYPHWYEEWDDEVRKYADENGLTYINLLDYTDEIGIDYSTDTFDGGLHMNLSGAQKCSDFLGSKLVEIYGLSDRRGEAELNNIWKEKIQRYNDDIAYQKELYQIEY